MIKKILFLTLLVFIALYTGCSSSISEETRQEIYQEGYNSGHIDGYIDGLADGYAFGYEGALVGFLGWGPDDFDTQKKYIVSVEPLPFSEKAKELINEGNLEELQIVQLFGGLQEKLKWNLV